MTGEAKPEPVRIRLDLDTHILVLPMALAMQVIEAIAGQEGYSLENKYSVTGTMYVIHEKVELGVWTATDHAKAVMDTVISREN
jgi:hypothetical protein